MVCEFSGLCREVDETCALLDNYAAFICNYLPPVRDSLSSWKMGPIGCPETSVSNYHYSLRDNPVERSSHLLRGRNPEIADNFPKFKLSTRNFPQVQIKHTYVVPLVHKALVGISHELREIFTRA